MREYFFGNKTMVSVEDLGEDAIGRIVSALIFIEDEEVGEMFVDGEDRTICPILDSLLKVIESNVDSYDLIHTAINNWRKKQKKY